MKTSALLRTLLLLALALAPTLNSSAAPTEAKLPDPARFDYHLEPRELAPGAYVFVGLREDFTLANGGNIVNTGFLVGTEGVVVIDTGPSRRYGEQMLAAIRRVTPLPVLLAINTHHHPDHFLGNQAFPAATLAALPETLHGIRKDGEAFNENLYRMSGDWMKGTERVTPAQALAPGRRSVGGRDIEIVALDGHTPADLVVIDHATGTVFAGDLLFHDRAATTPHANLAHWLAALDRLEAIPAKRWVPGHGEPAAGDAPIRQTRSYLEWLAATMRDGAESGLDMTEMLARPIPARFRGLAEVEREYRRSVVHLYPAAEQAVLEKAHAR
ncbi:quinoprotein relay system zinc metallohydrolase 1 [Aromatoleum toluclasticum]|uniref:quinoprotein relay system zinc metallohydrolase 1 n=1 Tax=Aromatoleum toluclasticum TaxID=92003 RepID=UPI001D18DEDA|nr:quinoprotein relay system zinc metallohydrolase 1 [Aromatoleum toluclasticum]MCC4115822.1 quinoprotein relay system zinc metallohydrolase 1 [Aromatoleum toluclasticum]